MIDDTIGNAMTMQPGNEGGKLGRIDQYELVRELGGGGFGTVFLAKDTVAGIEVAVKGLPPFVKNNREELENIRDNFALVSRLTHTNIAKALVLHPSKDVFYSSEDVRQKLRVLSGDTLMVMEYAPGVTLSKWRKQFPRGKVPFDKALSIVRQIASALDYAHGQKILHRDIKPANIMVETRDSERVVVRVLDFGLAAEIRSSMGRVSREIHDTSGTRPYMAPEQWEGARQGPATDQYSLAVLFHELVTGSVPFESVFTTGEPVVMAYAVLNKPFKAPEEFPRSVRRALEKALSKKPAERFANCCDFVDTLEGKATISRSGLVRREKGGGWKLLLVFALLLAMGGGTLFYHQKQIQQGEEARKEEDARKAEEARKEEEARRKKEALKAEETRKEEEARRKKDALKAEEARKEEEARRKKEALKAEEARKEEEARRKKDALKEKERPDEKNKNAVEEVQGIVNRMWGSAKDISGEHGFATRKQDLQLEIKMAEQLAGKSKWDDALQKYIAITNNIGVLLRQDSERNAALISRNDSYEAREAAKKAGAERFQETRNTLAEITKNDYNKAEELLNEMSFIKSKEKFDNAAEKYGMCKLVAETLNRAKPIQSPPSPPQKPELTIVAKLDGVEVTGAILETMIAKHTLPYKWTESRLSNRRSLGPYLVRYSKGNKEYYGSFSVTVNWTGPHEETVILKPDWPNDIPPPAKGRGGLGF